MRHGAAHDQGRGRLIKQQNNQIIMCEHCWEENGEPKIINEKTEAAAKLIAEVYKHHEAGGGLHIIVDDFNIERDHLLFCEQYIGRPEYVKEVSASRLKAERKCLAALMEMTEDERASALAIHDGYFHHK